MIFHKPQLEFLLVLQSKFLGELQFLLDEPDIYNDLHTA